MSPRKSHKSQGKSAQMTLKRPLSELFSVSGRFRRSVHLERDTLAPDALSGYRITPVALKTLRRVLWGVSADAGTRAWSLTGPYGSGKSSFAIFLAALFGAEDATGKRPRRQARQLLRDAGDSVSKEFLGETGKRRLPALFPVLITGERASLAQILLRGLDAGLKNIRGKKGRHKRIVALQKKVTRLLSEEVPTSAVVAVYDEANRSLIDTRTARGLLVVVDEAGKTLEYAAQNPAGTDVLLLQELAELAARSGETPFVFVTVFHQSFAGYGARLGPTQRNEWEKVQGRFEDVAFVEGWEQTLRLLGEALVQCKVEPGLVRKAERRVSKAFRNVAPPTILEPKKTEALLQNCLPLHPYVALLLGPLFRTGVFQNERSLFAFLASQEPSGLQDFIASQYAAGDVIPLFPVARLFDYVDYVLQSRVSFSRPHALRTAEVALQRVPDTAGPLGAVIVKSIALITWLGEKVGLRADLATLQESVPQASRKAIEKCLGQLSKASIVTFRKFRSSYVIWEGSDIAIDDLISDARRVSLSNEQAAAMLNTISPLDPIVARRHLFTKGTLRYFEVRFIAAKELEGALGSDDFGDEDGHINIVIYESTDEKNAVVGLIEDRLRVEAAHPWPVLSVLPTSPLVLHTLLSEYAALEKLIKDEPRLPHDPVAKREVDARKRGVETLLQQEVQTLLGHSSRKCSTWYYRGVELVVEDARALTSILSNICDKVFGQGPVIHNELVNRSVLSSSAASARRNLLAAMVVNPDVEAFGITGFPPEMSMYLTLFAGPHRLHGKLKGTWTLLEPAKTSSIGSIGPAWHCIQDYLSSRSGERFPLEELYDLLKSPPYGIKLGVIPILVLHFLTIRGESFALYENDAFIPSVTTAVIERLLKSPKNFHAQWYPLTDARLDVLCALGQALRIKPRSGKTAPSVLQVVKKLVRTTVELPKYSQLTRRLGEDALSLRLALSQAKEPAPLVFRQLPEALGMSVFHSEDTKAKGAKKFARRVASALVELESCYSGLLKHIEQSIAGEFGLADLSGDALKNELGGRGARLFPHANDPKLRAFLLRLVDADMPLEEWLVSIGTLFAKKPPEHWSDPDSDRYTKELVSVRHSFQELEALTLADEELSKKAENSPSKRRLFRIAIAELGEPLRERVVSLSRDQEKLAQSLRSDIYKIIKGASGGLTTEARLATLSSLASDLIHEAERNTSTQDTHHKDL